MSLSFAVRFLDLITIATEIKSKPNLSQFHFRQVFAVLKEGSCFATQPKNLIVGSDS